MKRLFFPLIAVMISACASFFLQGCTIRFVTNTQATPVPYPNAWHIESRVKAQINRISGGLQQGRLSQDSVNVLAENDALVRRLAREYQGPPAKKADLNGNQTVFLDNMLNDNDRYIEDAFQRNQAWVSSFQNGGFDYTSSDKTLFIVSLDYQLNRQQADVDSGLKASRLTRAQADEFRNRIKVIRELRYNDYRSNGRIDLSEEQVRQLSQMTEDNARYLRYRLKGNHGRWNREQFNTWKSRVPAGLGNGGHGEWGRGPRENGAYAQDSAGPNGVNPHVLNGSTTSTGLAHPGPDQIGQSTRILPSRTPTLAHPGPDQIAQSARLLPTRTPMLPSHSGAGQTVQPGHVLPTLTPTMGPRDSVQPRPVISTPLPTKDLGQTIEPTSIPPAPTNTPELKKQAPVLVPTNTAVIIRNPVLTPPPHMERFKAVPTKAPVKIQPTFTPSPKKDDQMTPGESGHPKEKGDEKGNLEGKKGPDVGDQGPGNQKKPDSNSSNGDNPGSSSQGDKGNGQGKNPGGGQGD